MTSTLPQSDPMAATGSSGTAASAAEAAAVAQAAAAAAGNPTLLQHMTFRGHDGEVNQEQPEQIHSKNFFIVLWWEHSCFALVFCTRFYFSSWILCVSANLETFFYSTNILPARNSEWNESLYSAQAC